MSFLDKVLNFGTDRYYEHFKVGELLANDYFEHLNEIQHRWSQISKFGAYTGEAADELEEMCLDSIEKFKAWVKHQKGFDKDWFAPKNVPAYRRLIMLYEKQGRFNEAIALCKDAIESEAADPEFMKVRIDRIRNRLEKTSGH